MQKKKIVKRNFTENRMETFIEPKLMMTFRILRGRKNLDAKWSKQLIDISDSKRFFLLLDLSQQQGEHFF